MALGGVETGMIMVAETARAVPMARGSPVMPGMMKARGTIRLAVAVLLMKVVKTAPTRMKTSIRAPMLSSFNGSW